MLPIVRRRSLFPDLTDDFFGSNLLSDFFDRPANASVPAVNIVEDSDSFKIEVAAPGLDKKDFKVNVDQNVLTVSSEKEVKEEKKDERYMRKEFSFSSFSRSFTLPNTVHSDKISASHKDGVLMITIPKKEEAKEKPPKEIKIS